MIKKVCVFASSCDCLDKIYYDTASELGELISSNGMEMVYGGSRLGLMWACAKAVKENGAKLIGIMPEKLKEMESDSEYCDEFFVTECMRTRKAKMDKMSDALVALPGGFGTLEELSEMIVQKQLGYNNKAIVILNTKGFYNELLMFFDRIMEEKFAHKKSSKLYFVASTPKEAIEYLKNYDSNEVVITQNDLYVR